MKATAPPTFSTDPPGPWGVDTIGNTWYVIHSTTLRCKAIGRVGARAPYNYFDRAIEEADRRNRQAAADQALRSK